MNATLAVISGRSLLLMLGAAIVIGALFWGAWRAIQLIKNPTLKTLAWIVWVVVLVLVCVDFFFGTIGVNSTPIIVW